MTEQISVSVNDVMAVLQERARQDRLVDEILRSAWLEAALAKTRQPADEEDEEEGGGGR